MQEIADNVFIESNFPGVILGAIRLRDGLLMVDAPFRPEDQRTWQNELVHLEAGPSRLLVMLDPHIDRTLGVRSMECCVIGQENSLDILRDRPTTARGQDIDAGADWEPFDLPPNIRWATPDITFSDQLTLYWDQDPVVLTQRSGAHFAGSWLTYDAKKVVFVGDSVIFNQPPFLAWANLPVWFSELDLLESAAYQGYKIVSGRNGYIRVRSVDKTRLFLQSVQASLDQIAAVKGDITAVLDAVPNLLKQLSFPKHLLQRYHNRLAWGLAQYYHRNYLESNRSNQGKSQ